MAGRRGFTLDAAGRGGRYSRPLQVASMATTDLKRETLRILARGRRSRRSPRRFLRDLCGTAAAALGRRGPPLPGVIIPGTMRGGTTSLFHYLAGHPQIAPSLVKEVHYFDLHFARGPRWYRRQFAARPRPAVGLEASPYYMCEPRVPARVRALVPDAKLVFLLRDPVARAFSHYRKNRRNGREPLDFQAAIAAEPERLAGEEAQMLDDPTYVSDLHRYYSYVGRGHYAEQLGRWREHFPAAQMLVVDAAELYAAPRRTLASVVEFLGLDPWEPASIAAHNAGGEDATPPAAAAATLAAHFAPHERRLVDLLGWCPSRPTGAAAA